MGEVMTRDFRFLSRNARGDEQDTAVFLLFVVLGTILYVDRVTR